MEVLTTYDSSHGCRGCVRFAPPPPALCVPGRVGSRVARSCRWWVVPYHDAAQRAGADAPAPTVRHSKFRPVAARSGGCELSHEDLNMACDGSGTSIAVFGTSKDVLFAFPNSHAEKDFQSAWFPTWNAIGHTWTSLHSDTRCAERYSCAGVLLRMSGRPRGTLVRGRSGHGQEGPVVAHRDDARLSNAVDHRLASAIARFDGSRLETAPDHKTSRQDVLRGREAHATSQHGEPA